MKKLIPILLVCTLLLSFTACTKKTPESNADALFFENTTWGMTKAETMKALKLKDSDLEKVEQAREAIDLYVVKDYVYNGNNCSLSVVFFNDKQEWASHDSLCNIILKFKDGVDIQTEIDAFTALLGEPKKQSQQTKDISSELFLYSSKKNQVDYLNENKISIDEYFDAKMSNKDLNTEEKIAYMAKTPLAKVTIHKYVVADKDGYAGSVDFDGSVYAGVETFNK